MLLNIFKLLFAITTLMIRLVGAEKKIRFIVTVGKYFTSLSAVIYLGCAAIYCSYKAVISFTEIKLLPYLKKKPISVVY